MDENLFDKLIQPAPTPTEKRDIHGKLVEPGMYIRLTDPDNYTFLYAFKVIKLNFNTGTIRAERPFHRITIDLTWAAEIITEPIYLHRFEIQGKEYAYFAEKSKHRALKLYLADWYCSCSYSSIKSYMAPVPA